MIDTQRLIRGIEDHARTVYLNAQAARDYVAPQEVNEPFLREVMAYIELHQERWNQHTWGANTKCGTVHCIAGWAYVLGTGCSFDQYNVPNDLVPRAAELLGLPLDTAWDLFHFVGERRWDSQLMQIVSDPPPFQALCDKVEELTGVTFKPAPEVMT